MSATNRGAARVDKDFYPTNPWIVHRFLEVWQGGSHLRHGDKRPWLEPCAGDGSIIRATNALITDTIDKRWSIDWHAVELRDDFETQETLRSSGVSRVYPGWDFLKWPPPGHAQEHDGLKPYAVAMTNPPYSIAQKVIEHAMLFADTVVMLLRVNFFGSSERNAFLRNYAPDVYVIPNRPSFGVNEHGKKGTDATEYAWFVWHGRRPAGSIQVLNLTSDEVRAAEWQAAFGHLVKDKCECVKCKYKDSQPYY